MPPKKASTKRSEWNQHSFEEWYLECHVSRQHKTGLNLARENRQARSGWSTSRLYGSGSTNYARSIWGQLHRLGRVRSRSAEGHGLPCRRRVGDGRSAFDSRRSRATMRDFQLNPNFRTNPSGASADGSCQLQKLNRLEGEARRSSVMAAAKPSRWRRSSFPGRMFQEILRLIAELRPKPPPAPASNGRWSCVHGR